MSSKTPKQKRLDADNRAIFEALLTWRRVPPLPALWMWCDFV